MFRYTLATTVLLAAAGYSSASLAGDPELAGTIDDENLVTQRAGFPDAEAGVGMVFYLGLSDDGANTSLEATVGGDTTFSSGSTGTVDYAAADIAYFVELITDGAWNMMAVCRSTRTATDGSTTPGSCNLSSETYFLDFAGGSYGLDLAGWDIDHVTLVVDEVDVTQGLDSDGNTTNLALWDVQWQFWGTPLDSDADGLSDLDEDDLGTDPLDDDTDDDGLLDGAEVELGTDPTDDDTDDDGLLDGSEVDIGTDPLDEDTDDDTLSDGTEVDGGTNPLDPDTDGDGLTDDVDPSPTDPGVTDSQLEEMAYDLSEEFAALDLDLFDAPNNNAAKGRRNSLATRLANVAKAIADGDYDEALDILDGIRDRLDGVTPPPDWLEAGTDQEDLLDEVDLLIALLEDAAS